MVFPYNFKVTFTLMILLVSMYLYIDHKYNYSYAACWNERTVIEKIVFEVNSQYSR